MNKYTVTYKDKALNPYVYEIEALCWSDAIIKAFEIKKEEHKLISIVITKDETFITNHSHLVGQRVRYIGQDLDLPFCPPVGMTGTILRIDTYSALVKWDGGTYFDGKWNCALGDLEVIKT